MKDELISEGCIPLPISLTLKKQPGTRYQLLIYHKLINGDSETCINFYDQEQLYMHVDNGMLAVGVVATQPEPGIIKRILKGLIHGKSSEQFTK
jgi:hypothetical protein